MKKTGFPTPFSALLLLLLPALSAAQGGLPTAPRSEVFRAGEALSIQTPLEPAGLFNGGYPIDSAGYADFPVVGRVHVAGRAQHEVEAFLSQRLSNYLKDVNVKVTPCIRLTMLGHWVRQGQYYVDPKGTVWEAAFAAGGLAGGSTIDKIRVLRGETELEVSFLDEYSRGRSLEAAGLRSGDIVVVPVPNELKGFWYWFKEGLGATAQIAAVASTVITVIITYQLLSDNRGN